MTTASKHIFDSNNCSCIIFMISLNLWAWQATTGDGSLLHGQVEACNRVDAEHLVHEKLKELCNI